MSVCRFRASSIQDSGYRVYGLGLRVADLGLGLRM